MSVRRGNDRDGKEAQRGMSHDHPYMPLYFGDLLKQTMYWSGEERALLILLMAAQWWNGALPLDLSRLAGAIQYDEETFFALWNGRVHSLFVETPDGYVNDEIEERRITVARLSGARRAAGQASGKARRSRAEQTSDALFEQTSEQDVRTKPRTNGGAYDRTPIQSNPIQSRPIQEPTISEQPSADREISSPIQPPGADPPPAASANGATNTTKKPPRSRRIPADYDTDRWREWATANTPGINFDGEIAMLRDHEFRDAHSDWDAVVRNWLRRADKQTSRERNEHLTRYERHKRRLYGGNA